MQRYFNCRVRRVRARERISRVRLQVIIIIIFIYIRLSVMCPGRRLGLPQPGDRAFAVFFSLILRERGDYLCSTDVLFLRLFILRCRASDFYRDSVRVM